MKICNFYLFSMLHHLDARMRTAAIRTCWRNGKITFFFFFFFGDMFLLELMFSLVAGCQNGKPFYVS